MRRRRPFLFAAVALTVGLGSELRAQEPAPTPSPTPVQAVAAPAATEPPKCADCHEEQVKGFANNPHARFSHKKTRPGSEDFCATCHGDGTKHIQADGDIHLIQTFRTAADAELCASCHDKADPHGSFATGFHANSAAVNCLSCHSIHKAVPRNEHLLAKDPGALCQTCHTGIAASLRNKPYTHRLDRGGMTCVDCHDPHDRKGQPVKLTREGELACLTCHAEKRGPFVFDHVTGSAGDCLSCHQPHGSNNPKQLLWARVDQLCLSCHSQTGGPRTAGPQPPAFHDLTLPRYRNCTSCHVAIHGSNLSPAFLK